MPKTLNNPSLYHVGNVIFVTFDKKMGLKQILPGKNVLVGFSFDLKRLIHIQ